MQYRRIHRGISAASGTLWFFVFAILIVATLSYKGVGVITYPPEAAKWPVIGQWLNVPKVEPEPAGPRELTVEQQLTDLTNRQTQQIAVLQQQQSQYQADLDQREQEILRLQADLARLQDQLNLQKDAQKQAVAKIYERMEAEDAVKILEGMQPERAAIIVGGMKDQAAAEVLGLMDPPRARLISDILAGFTPPLESGDIRAPDAGRRPPLAAGRAPGGATVAPGGGAITPVQPEPVDPGADDAADEELAE